MIGNTITFYKIRNNTLWQTKKKIETLNKKLFALSDDELNIVTGGKNIDECMQDLYNWIDNNPTASPIEIYDYLKDLFARNMDKFSEIEKKQAQEILDALAERA